MGSFRQSATCAVKRDEWRHKKTRPTAKKRSELCVAKKLKRNPPECKNKNATTHWRMQYERFPGSHKLKRQKHFQTVLHTQVNLSTASYARCNNKQCMHYTSPMRWKLSPPLGYSSIIHYLTMVKNTRLCWQPNAVHIRHLNHFSSTAPWARQRERGNQ